MIEVVTGIATLTLLIGLALGLALASALRRN
jgi:hypothetical protein